MGDRLRTMGLRVGQPLCWAVVLSAACVAAPASEDDSPAVTTEGEGSASSMTAAGTSTGASETGSTTDTGEAGTPIEQAAMLACAALETAEVTSIPSGEGAFRETGFRLGSDFPYHFRVDSFGRDPGWEAGDYTCYDVFPPQNGFRIRRDTPGTRGGSACGTRNRSPKRSSFAWIDLGAGLPQVPQASIGAWADSLAMSAPSSTASARLVQRGREAKHAGRTALPSSPVMS
jgi:hypothetical protein